MKTLQNFEFALIKMYNQGTMLATMSSVWSQMLCLNVNSLISTSTGQEDVPFQYENMVSERGDSFEQL